MTRLLALLFVGALAFGSSLPSGSVQGEYIEARNADVYTGPCFANSEGGLMGELAVFGWHITKGSWQGVNLDNMSVVAAIKASGTLGDVYRTSYPVKAVLIVDKNATPLQRQALVSFAKKMGGDLLADVVKVESEAISLEIRGGSVHAANAKLTAGSLASIETRALNENDHICRNEEIWYSPLTKVNHAMPAYAVANTFEGKGLGTQWSSPLKRSAFVGNFSVAGE